MRKPTDTFLVACFVLSASLANAGESWESNYFHQRCLPAIAEFVQQNSLPIETGNLADQTIHRDITINTNANYASAKIRLRNDHVFLVRERRGGTEVWGYSHLAPHIDRVMTTGSLREMREVAARTNLLTMKSATIVADRYFTLQGYRPEDFTRTVAHQIAWGATDDPDYTILPFYEFRWTRGNAESTLHESQKPTVRIVVSGITSNMAGYASWIALKPEDRPTNLVERLEMLAKKSSQDAKPANTP